MAIQAPNFCKDAVPSLQGWRHPSTNELLKSQRLEQWQIDEWFGNTPAEEPKPAPKAALAPQPVAVEVVEEPVLQADEPVAAPAPQPVAVAAPKPAPKKKAAPKRKIGSRIKKAVNHAKAEVKDVLD